MVSIFDRREAYAIYPNHSQIFKVEISSFEYTAAKKLIDARGAIFYVYTPEMIVFEKIRALCQSMPEYKEIVPSSRPKGRARDVYDIWNICQKYTIDAGAPDNKRMFREIFRAKRVPLDFLDLLPNYRGFQKEDWVNVLNTLTHEDEKGFGFYFDHMIQLAQTLKTP